MIDLVRRYDNEEEQEMKVKKKADGSYKVKVKLTLTVGRKFHISPSQGFQGLYDGVVEILTIGTEEEINSKAFDYRAWDVDGEEKVLTFVHFRYVYTLKNNPEDEGQDILPIELFVDHISQL